MVAFPLNKIMSKKVRVAFFSTYYPEYRDAVFSRLAKHPDIEFSFFVGKPPTGSFIQASDATRYECRPIRVLSLAVPGTRNAISYRTGAVSALLRRKYDVLILSNDILGIDVWLCSMLSRLAGVRVCIWGQGLSRPPSRLRNAMRFALTSLATAAVYYSDGGRDYWLKRKIPEEKLFVAYNALDTDKQIRIREEMKPEALEAHLAVQNLTGKRIVTFLGRLIREKKPRLFIDVVAEAASRDSRIVGVLIGDGPERGRLEQYVRERCLTDRIRFVGAIYDEPTMAKYLMSSVAVVLPAFAGLAIQHAGVYGVPMILGDVPYSHGPEQEIVEEGKTGLWCPDEDVDAFASAILRLVRDPVYRDSLSINIRRVIDEKYTVARMAQGFVDAVQYCSGE
jgi:glycosyltransferase involved in cell wall biosynthesis